MDASRWLALLRALEPWLACARDRGALELDAFAADEPLALAEGLWIQWRLETDSPTVQDAEAMEILDLFVRVDYRAAWAALFDMFGYPTAFADRLDEAPLRRYPRFMLRGFSALCEVGMFRRSMSQFVFELGDDAHAQGYHETKALLVSLQKHPIDVIDLCLDVQLIATSRIMARRDASLHVLEEVAAFTALCQDPARAELLSETALGEWGIERTKKPWRRFRIESMSAGYNAVTVSNSLLIAGLNLTVELGVRLDGITIGSASYSLQRLSPQVGATFFHTMISAPTSTCRNLALQSHVQIEPFSGACSSLLKSPNIRSVEICLPEVDADDCDHRLFWPWVALSIFSAEATNRVEELELNVFHLSDRHVQAFRAVLIARDPLSAIPCISGRQGYIPPSPEQLAREPMEVELRSGTPLLFSANDEFAVLATSNQGESFRLVDDSPDRQYVAVLRDGAGVCWIHRNNVVARRLIALQSCREGKVQKLKLELIEGMRLEPVVDMLQIIGSGLQALHIGAFGSVGLDDAFLHSVFQACPRLLRLDLTQVSVASFRWLPLHDDNDLGTHLDSLSLSGVTCQDPAAYSDFISAISSTNSPLCSRLRQLHIQRDANLLELEWPRAFTILDANTRLEQLLLSADYNAADVEIEQDLRDQLEEKSGVALHVQKSPFPVRSRLAFLSVISRQPHEEIMSKRQRLALPDLSVEHISAIWKYAAPHKERICGLVPFRP